MTIGSRIVRTIDRNLSAKFQKTYVVLNNSKLISSAIKTDHNSREKAKERCNSDGHPRSLKESQERDKRKICNKKEKEPTNTEED